MSRPLVSYFTMGFPVTSETAVIREMYALAEGGLDIHVFATRPPNFDGIFEPKALRFREVARGPTPANMAKGMALLSRRLARRDPAVLEILEAVNRSGHLRPKVASMVAVGAAAAVEMQQSGVQYVHANFASLQGFGAWVVHKLLGIPFGFTMHAHDLFIHGFLMEEKIRDASLVVSISQYNLYYLRERWGIVRDDIPIIHCGVDVNEFVPVPHSRGKELRLISIGRLAEMKGFAFLIDAVALLKDPSIKLTIVGKGDDADILLKQVVDLELTEQVSIRSGVKQDELRQLLHQADVYVQPSIRCADGMMEGIPATLMEAMAMELPCISTRLSGIPELVHHHKTGLLVDPGDCTRLSEAIGWMREHPEEARVMGKEGRKVVEDEFDADKNAKELGRRMREVLNHG